MYLDMYHRFILTHESLNAFEIIYHYHLIEIKVCMESLLLFLEHLVHKYNFTESLNKGLGVS